MINVYPHSEDKRKQINMIKVGGVGGCAELIFSMKILRIYNYVGLKKTLALQSIKTKTNLELSL